MRATGVVQRRRSSRRWVSLVAVSMVASVLVACAPTAPPTPRDGGPLPDGLDFTSVPWKPDEAPKLLEQMRALLVDPTFPETLDPATRDQTLNSIRELVNLPDAEAQIRDYLTKEQQSGQEWTQKRRLPPPPTKAQIAAVGGSTDVTPVKPAGETPTFPKTEPASSPSLSYGNVSPSAEPATDIVPVAVEETAERWPSADSPSAWPVYGGSHADAIGEEWARLTGRREPDGEKALACTPSRTGSRGLPSQPIPSFETRIFTPTQGAYASTGQPGGPTNGQVVVASGDLQTRMDPNGSGIRQFKVEAHLLSPTIFQHWISGTYQYFTPDMFRAHIVVEQIGTTNKYSYWTNSPHVEFKTLCYKEDAGVTNARRAYVEAWIPMVTPDEFTPDLNEPGFQIRFESVDNYWDSSTYFPKAFYAADQHTVLLTASGVPLGIKDPLANGSVAIRVSDGLLVDRDNDPLNDLESALKAQVMPQVGPALESFQGMWKYIWQANTWFWINDVDANSYELDLDLTSLPNDDEYALKGTFKINDLFVKGLMGSSLPCYFQARLRGAVSVSATIDIGSNPQALKLNTSASVFDLGVSDVFASPLPLACNLFYLIKVPFSKGYLDQIGTEKLQDVLDQTLSTPLDLNLDDTLAPGATLANGNGFGLGFAGFVPSCPPLGCQGGDVLMDEHGVVLKGALSAYDKKPAFMGRRFPYVFNPTIGSALTDAYMSDLKPSGYPYSIGAFVTPAVINQILRALTEGSILYNGLFDLSATVGSSQLTLSPEVAPFVLTEGAFGLPFAIYVPDLRIDDGDNTLAANVTVGFGVTIDAQTRKLVPSLMAEVDFDTLTCGFSPNMSGSPLETSYGLCASNDWTGNFAQPPLLPSIADAGDWLVNTVIPPLLQNSIGEIEIPPASGFDFLSLGNSSIENVNGILAVYLGETGSTPKVGVFRDLGVPFGPSPAPWELKLKAFASYLPGFGPITYDWKIEDLNSGYVFDPPPTTSASNAWSTVTDSWFNYQLPNPFSGQRKAKATVTATRAGATVSSYSLVTGPH